MRRYWSLLALLVPMVPTACGGGGGDNPPTPPIAATASLQVAALPIAADVNLADLTVSLTASAELSPTLLEAHIELPPQLRLPATGRLVAATPLVMLDGDFVNGRFVVLCGDARNANAQALPNGALFRLALVPTEPRTPGTYTVTLSNLRAASSAGENVPIAPDAITVPVTIL